MAGFDEIRTVAHAMEDVLGEARDRGALDTRLVEPLLAAVDAIRRMLAGQHGLAGEVIERLALGADAPGDEPEPRAAMSTATEPRSAVTGAAQPPASEHAASPEPGERRSMRVPAGKVDRLLDVAGEAMLHHRRLEHLIDVAERTDSRVSEELDRGEVLFHELQDSVISMRTLPLSSITAPYPRAVRDLALEHGKDVELLITGAETQLDRAILDGISETLAHVLRNAVSHGIEPPQERERNGKSRRGRIELRAEQQGGMVVIEISDDGKGVSQQTLDRAREAGSLTELLATPGFSTASAVTDISGRGVGLDAVKTQVESLGGSFEIVSRPGDGTRVSLQLPLTLALLQVLLVERGGRVYAIPVVAIREVITVADPTSLAGTRSVALRGASIRVVDLAELLGAQAPELGPRPPGVVVSAAEHRVAIVCDRLLGEEDVVMKSLGLLSGTPGYLGGAILGDGRIALVADPAFLTRAPTRGRTGATGPAESARAPRVLVVDDQFTVRELQRSILEAAGYDVITARDGREGLTAVETDRSIELVVTDIEMPEMDGYALLQSIRTSDDRGALPVVIVTSKGAEADRRRGAELGADAYIVKDDFNQQALLETVRRLVGR
jgi:two-component system chemotaxis sensor kinase CheA